MDFFYGALLCFQNFTAPGHSILSLYRKKDLSTFYHAFHRRKKVIQVLNDMVVKTEFLFNYFILLFFPLN